MATYIGKSGKSYTVIEPALGKGGEGSVYKISGMPDYVLKVFHPANINDTLHNKLLVMIKTPLSASAMKQITWPIDTVYENNKFVGYVMPAIQNNEPLNVMHSNKYIITLSEKINIAKNLCAAINSVHNAGQVCGDLNPKNIIVDPKTTRITLVDTDSYHITDKSTNRVYRCNVGRPEYLPKEIQDKLKNGITLRNAPLDTFTRESDLFALAIHIFALLMNGCHPFACAVNNQANIGPLSVGHTSVTAPQPIDNIKTGFFTFYQKKAGFNIPVYAPEFDSLPSDIQKLFIRAFVDGHNTPAKRPDAVEWYNALNTMQQNLVTCKKDKYHMYSKHLKNCPWCEVKNRILPIPTPTNTNTTTGSTTTKKTYTTVTPPSNNKGNKSYPSKASGIMASSGMFWFLTIAITLIGQFLLFAESGNDIIGTVFGTQYGNGIESIGINIGIWLGPWGFIISALLGTIIYNCCWGTSGKRIGYRWYHYVLSILTAAAFNLAYVLAIFLISLAIYIAVIALGILLICGFISGS